MARKSLGVIDVGSHSVHFEIFDIRSGHEPRSLYSKSEPSHMGRVVGEQGRIPSSLEHHLKASLGRLVKKAKKKNVERIIIGATAGFRKASNGEFVIQQLERRLGLPMHLLTQERESELGFSGIMSDLDAHTPQLFIDCGGGSTEVSLSRGRKRIAHTTLPFGNSLLSLNIQNDPPQGSDVVAILLPWIRGLTSLPDTLKPEQALVSGGTIADLMTILTEGITQTVTLKHLDTVVAVVLKKRSKKLAKKYDLELEDVRNLLPSALTLSSLLKYYRLDRTAFTAKSVRNGMAKAYQKSGENWWKGTRPHHAGN